LKNINPVKSWRILHNPGKVFGEYFTGKRWRVLIVEKGRINPRKGWSMFIPKKV
jgi:hypothetical protein